MAASVWLSWLRSPLRVRRRRMMLSTLAIFAIWFLFSHRLRDVIKYRSRPVTEYKFHEDGGYVLVGANDPMARLNPGAGSDGSIGRGSGGSGASSSSSNFGGSSPSSSHPASDDNDNEYDWIDEYGRRASMVEKGGPRRGEKPPPPKAEDKVTGQTYEGSIVFYNLPLSMQSLVNTDGYRAQNGNVLFAAASLQSASVLIQLACDMAARGFNKVHLAFFGREDVPLEQILSANNVLQKSCRVHWHDARPDYTKYSSETRAEASVRSALTHIQDHMHPQVIITDNFALEEGFFGRAVSEKAKEFAWAVIELPPDQPQTLTWITRLDSKALAAWHRPSVEIIIQAASESAGSLIRLLNSLSKADYSGMNPPSITIELPAEVDVILQRFLLTYTWPPHPTSSAKLTIRHRIPIHSTTSVESSIRFLESFYPINPFYSHILLFSPQAEVSPLYYHYLQYYILKYRHSIDSTAATHPRLLGIGLDVPASYLNGSDFAVPEMKTLIQQAIEDSKPESKNARPPFTWQAPNSNAVLYFGEKWVEMHSFLSLRLAKFNNGMDARQKEKAVGQHMPAWTEYALELIRARGYSLLYPGCSIQRDSFVTVHKDLAYPPEEFEALLKPSQQPGDESSNEKSAPSASPSPANDPQPNLLNKPFKDPFVAPKPLALPPRHGQHDHAMTGPSLPPLHHLLPFTRDDPPLYLVPHLAFDGARISERDAFNLAVEESARFRKEVGGCSTKTLKNILQLSAEDLFCFGSEDREEYQSRDGSSSHQVGDVKPKSVLHERPKVKITNKTSEERDI